MTTGHEEARQQIAGETGYEARELHGVIVFSDGRTEHASIFYADPDRKAVSAEERAEADEKAKADKAAADEKAKAEKAAADEKAAKSLTSSTTTKPAPKDDK